MPTYTIEDAPAAPKYTIEDEPASKPSPPSGISRFLTSAVAPIKGAIQSFSGQPTEEEKAKGLTSLYDAALRPFERAVEAQTGQVDEARELAKQGRYSEATAHGIASVVPLVGPWVADAAQQYFGQLKEGDTAGAMGTLTGNAALALGPKALGKILPKVKAAPEKVGRGIRSLYGAGPKDLTESATKTAEGANKAAESAETANKAATETTLAKRGKVDEKNRTEATEHEEAKRTAEENTLRERGEIDRKNEEIERKNREARKTSDEKTLAARGKVDQRNAEIKAKNEAAKQEVIRKNREAKQKHAAEKARIDQENRAAKEAQGKRKVAQKKLDEASAEMRARTETARERALKEGNEKYNGVNAALNPIVADNEAVINAFTDSMAKIKGTEVEPPIFKGLGKRIEAGDILNYEDLQGFYSELGRELSKGTLPGDVFHAYDTLHEAIGNEMQRIADSKGQGAKLAEARNYWRRMKQTFGRPLSMTDNATDALRTANPEFLKSDEYQNQLRLLGSFDPEIPKAAEGIANLRQGLDALPKEQPLRGVLKVPPAAPEELPTPKPEPLIPYGEPEDARIDPRLLYGEPHPVPPAPEATPYGEPEAITPIERPTLDPRQIREQDVAKKMENWKSLNKYQITHLASGAIGMVYEALTGNIGYEGLTAIYSAAPLTPIVLAKIAENPMVREWLTRPQPGDLELLEKIPHADRVKITNALSGAVKQAAKSGKPIPLSPAVSAFLGVQQPRKRVGDLLKAP